MHFLYQDTKVTCSARRQQRWDGTDLGVFRSSNGVAIGEEVGHHFTKMVRKMKCTFSAFVAVMNDDYNLNYTSSHTFVDTKTFIRWWFAWASHQDIEFRNPCEWCGWQPKILAGDETQVGIPLCKAAFVPINCYDPDKVVSKAATP